MITYKAGIRGIALANDNNIIPPKKNFRKRAASSSLKDTFLSSNTFTPINKGKTVVASGRKNTQIKSKARAKVNEEILRLETCLRYASEYTLFPELKCTLAPNSITISIWIILRRKLVIDSNTELSSSIISAIAELEVNREEVADRDVDTTDQKVTK
ncbi:uncharacterized protein RAG0_11863 [Rhynchosporium agropyri]|uniref:Uncharacterized protein n=1 Tax=Rhynchosporium agropyri TaxID=914238 RepID=A0A1E1L6C7_9HELO|nr:uncharacterized protein RAG0_11863 [Rhynchosporium agropyri]